MSRYSADGLPLSEIAKLRDEDIDYSDIPELGDEFFSKARLVMPADGTEEVTLTLKRSVVDAFKAKAGDPRNLMNAVLEGYAGAVLKGR